MATADHEFSGVLWSWGKAALVDIGAVPERLYRTKDIEEAVGRTVAPPETAAARNC